MRHRTEGCSEIDSGRLKCTALGVDVAARPDAEMPKKSESVDMNPQSRFKYGAPRRLKDQDGSLDGDRELKQRCDLG